MNPTNLHIHFEIRYTSVFRTCERAKKFSDFYLQSCFLTSSEILYLTIVVYLKICFSRFMKKLIYAKARETLRSQWVNQNVESN